MAAIKDIKIKVKGTGKLVKKLKKAKKAAAKLLSVLEQINETGIKINVES